MIDKIKGIFTSPSDESQNEPINTPEQENIVQMVLQDFDVFKESRQGIEDVFRMEQRFYMGDHWHGLRSEAVSRMRPNSVDNVAWSQIEAIVAKLCGWMPQPDFEAQEDQDEQKAQELNDFLPYELRQIKFKEKHIRAIRRMAVHGPLIYKVIYDPTVEGGRGQNRFIGQNDILPVDLGSFFPDPRIKDFIHLQKAAANIVITRKPLEYFRERWGAQGNKVLPDQQLSDVEIFNRDEYSPTTFNSAESGGVNAPTTGNQTSGLIEYWYRGVPKYMSKKDKSLFAEQAQEKLAQSIDPSEDLAKSKGKMDGIHCIYISSNGVFLEHKAYVYDHGKYPFVARTLFPDEGNVWGKGFMRDMIKPQIMLNKFAEIAVETMAKAGNQAIVYEDGAITKPNVWQEKRSMPGAMLPVAQGRMNDWKELQGVDAPATVFNMLNYYKDMLQKIPGQFDSSVGQSNPNVTSGEQAKALIAAAGARLNVASELIEDALSEVFEQYICLIAQFYNTERVSRVTGKVVAMSRERLVSHTQSTYKVETDEGEQDVPVTEEYVPDFDIRVHIGVDKPQDRQYYIQLAFDMLNMKDPVTGLPLIDGEGVEYAVQNGRLEPFEVIRQRIEEKAGLMQSMMQLQQENERMKIDNAQLSQHVNTLGQMAQQNRMLPQQNVI